jgi:hypothetical protein
MTKLPAGKYSQSGPGFEHRVRKLCSGSQAKLPASPIA